MSSAPWATDRAVSSVRNSGESGSAKANCSPTFGRAELPPFPESHPQQTSSEATTIEKHRRIFMGSSELTVIIQRAVRILKRANSPPKLFHISRLRPSAPLGQHPNYPPPPHRLADTDRFSSAAVCISGHANSSCNSFNARGLCAPAPLDQHRKILHPLACPLRLFSQGPQTQTAHDGNENRSLFDPLGHHRRVRFDSKPGLQRHPLLLPRCPQTRTRASGFPPRQTPGHHPPMSHPNRSTPPADHSVRHLSLPNPAHRPPPVRLWTASV